MRAALLWAGLSLAAVAARADIVFTNAGDELTGAVRAIDGDKVALDSEGKTLELARKDILRIKLVRQWRIPSEDDPSRIADEAVQAVLKAPAKAEDYPQDGYLTALDDLTCELKADGASSCSRRKVQLILRERGKDEASNVRFYYLDGAQRGGIDYARSITGAKVSYLDDTSVQEGSENPSYPLYDKLKSTKFAIPNVSTGSILDYRYHIDSAVHSSTFPFFGSMFFRSFEPAVLTRLTVVVPKGVDLQFAERFMPAGARRREEAGDRVRTIWELRDQPSYKKEDQMPPYSRLAPSVRFALPDSWEALGARMAALLTERLAADAGVSAKALELVAGRSTAAEKVEALYDWVAREIAYQPVDMDSSSYLPRTPAEIFHSKSGNDLDKPFLLYAMLREAGFEPRLLYMESKNADPFVESLPNLRQFSAAAVALELDGKTLLLAPFEDAFRYRQTPGWLQGAHGLVVLGGKPGTLFFNPVSEPGADGTDSKLRLALSADGSIKADYTGHPSGSYEAGWRGLKDLKKEDLDQYFEKLAHGIHPNARLSSYSIEHLEDPTRSLVVHMAYAIPDYAITAAGGYLAFRLPWVERPASDVGQSNRETPMFWLERELETETAEVSLPQGYSLYYAPQDAALGAPGYSYKASYKPQAGGLDFSESFGRGATEIAPQDYAAYKSFREDTARFAEKWIVLKKQAPPSDRRLSGSRTAP